MSEHDQSHPLETERVEVDEHIEAAPSEVFEYLADPERRPFGRDDFLRLGDLIVGDEARDAGSPDGARIAWEVTVADGVERLGGTVEILVRPEGTGSRVLVTHRIASAVEVPSAVRALALAA